MLGHASKLFARLTLGRYASVRGGFDDADRPTLRCVQADGRVLDVESLSEGTRDQLYLSLRLASLAMRAPSITTMLAFNCKAPSGRMKSESRIASAGTAAGV